MVRLSLRNSDQASPWSSMREWSQEFDQIFDDMNRVFAPIRTGQGTLSSQIPCDVHESDSGYLLSIDIPGVSKDDISVEFNGGVLVVSGTRSSESTSKDLKSHRIERTVGSFQRSFRMPEGVDPENIQANYENGVLYLNLPKMEVAKPRKISIGESKSGFLKGLLGKSESKISVESN